MQKFLQIASMTSGKALDALLRPLLKRLIKHFASENSLFGYCVECLDIATPERIDAYSAEGRRALEFWFDISQLAEWNISNSASSYYDRKHPKHHLWIEHSRYLYDGVYPGERVLDIGCGGSFYTQWIAEKAKEVVGVDILPDRIALARSNNKKSNVHCELTDVTKDLPAGRFDVVICSHMLEHFENPVGLLRSVASKVSRQIVKAPLVDSHWMKLEKRDIRLSWMDDPTDIREYTDELLLEHLEAGGWEPDELIRGFDLRATARSKHVVKA